VSSPDTCSCGKPAGGAIPNTACDTQERHNSKKQQHRCLSAGLGCKVKGVSSRSLRQAQLSMLTRDTMAFCVWRETVCVWRKNRTMPVAVYCFKQHPPALAQAP
jgi:hypothetical protein